MAQIHHFDLGWITPTVSYVLSVLGSMLGLTCAIRLRAAHSRGERLWWLALSSIAIGGTAIWSMHFVAMMGFKVVGSAIRYDVGLTAASAILAIAAVALGMAIATYGTRARNVRIILGGVVAGLGVAAMHYTGMAAMQVNGDISYGGTRVGLSIAIAVIAAAVALWLAVTVQRPLIVFVSALVMGVAVNGMHFTGMSAMSVRPHRSIDALTGATATSMIVPIGMAVIFGIIGLAYALMAAPTEEDRAAAAYLAARREGLDTAAPTPAREPFRRQPSEGLGATGPARHSAPPGTLPSFPSGTASGTPSGSAGFPSGPASDSDAGAASDTAFGAASNTAGPQSGAGRTYGLGTAAWTYRDRERSGQ